MSFDYGVNVSIWELPLPNVTIGKMGAWWWVGVQWLCFYAEVSNG